MTTTGQFLVANSTLPSGTALQHLLALQIGAGNGQIVFASQFTAVVDTPRAEFTSKPKRVVAPSPASEAQVDQSNDRKSLFALVGVPRLDVAIEPDEIWVRFGVQSVASTVTAKQTSYTTKGIAQ